MPETPRSHFLCPNCGAEFSLKTRRLAVFCPDCGGRVSHENAAKPLGEKAAQRLIHDFKQRVAQKQRKETLAELDAEEVPIDKASTAMGWRYQDHLFVPKPGKGDEDTWVDATAPSALPPQAEHPPLASEPNENAFSREENRTEVRSKILLSDGSSPALSAVSLPEPLASLPEEIPDKHIARPATASQWHRADQYTSPYFSMEKAAGTTKQTTTEPGPPASHLQPLPPPPAVLDEQLPPAAALLKGRRARKHRPVDSKPLGIDAPRAGSRLIFDPPAAQLTTPEGWNEPTSPQVIAPPQESVVAVPSSELGPTLLLDEKDTLVDPAPLDAPRSSRPTMRALPTVQKTTLATESKAPDDLEVERSALPSAESTNTDALHRSTSSELGGIDQAPGRQEQGEQSCLEAPSPQPTPSVAQAPTAFDGSSEVSEETPPRSAALASAQPELETLPPAVFAHATGHQRSYAGLVLVLVAVLLLVAGLALALSGQQQAQVPAEVEPSPALDIEAPRARLGFAAAIAYSRSTLLALSSAEAIAQRCVEQAEQAFEAGDNESASVWLGHAHLLAPPSAESLELQAELLLAAKQFDAARQALRSQRLSTPELELLFERSFDEDPRFAPPVYTLSRRELSAIRSLGGGSTITLRFKSGRDTSAAFKPHQSRRQSNYRSEIAAWRLCELLDCSFAIPYNRPVRLTKSDFLQLYQNGADASQLAYAENFVDLLYQLEGGTWYLYGTEKEWVPVFTQFPIELEEVWQPWLVLTGAPELLEAPLDKALAPLFADRSLAKKAEKVMELSEATDTRGLAGQISDILLFDYLVGNWDRFSTVKDWWGTNCQFAAGQIVSIDNGAAFPNFANKKVKSKFEMVERFRTSMVRELRALDKERTLARLFPDASKREQEMFEQFWTQRELALARIDALIAQHGESSVLYFD
ncbi:MAG: hypothetical protein RBU37_11725 [Myxococcota bacterium]|jgi:predicted  nucleic acid-binding Zn-ribbon protein|nr:hypothetical protein [Myxococcota bacterium]